MQLEEVGIVNQKHFNTVWTGWNSYLHPFDTINNNITIVIKSVHGRNKYILNNAQAKALWRAFPDVLRESDKPPAISIDANGKVDIKKY